MNDPDFTDDFSDMSAPAEARADKDGNVRPPGILFVTAPAVNSIEISILEMMVTEPLLFPPPVEFLDGDGQVEPQNPAEVEMYSQACKHIGLGPDGVPWSPQIGELQDQIHAELQFHASLARSLGESGTIEDYRRKCIAEGVAPLALRDYR
jgi:hypothetical protein